MNGDLFVAGSIVRSDKHGRNRFRLTRPLPRDDGWIGVWVDSTGRRIGGEFSLATTEMRLVK